MPETNTISKLKELLALGFQVKAITNYIMADPNQSSPLTVKLAKNDEEITLEFTSKDRREAELIVNK